VAFLRRQLVTAALVANAVRPLPGYRVGIPAFFAGWLASELAPHLLAVTAVDTAVHVRSPRRSRAALALAAANTAGLTYLVTTSRGVQDVVEKALTEALGVDYVEQLDEKPTPADLQVRLRDVARPFRFASTGIRIVRDVPFSDAGARGMLDLYLPDGAEGEVKDAPVLLQVHGGAWTIGKKEQQGQPLMRHLAAKGWVCVAINYRLAPRDPFPAQIIDVKKAIAWIREHIAEYGGNPDYIAITGGSAGGHLAALAAVTPNDPAYQPGFEDADTSVAVAIPHYGVYDFAGSTGLRSAELMRDGFLAPRVIKKRWSEAPEVFEAGSPLLRVGPDAPDFFVLHGAHDSLVSVEQARLFVEELRRVSGASVVYAELPGAQHAFDIFHSIRSAHVVKAIDRYLHWHWNSWRAARQSSEEQPVPR
jgi:acetyl esterase/lipase